MPIFRQKWNVPLWPCGWGWQGVVTVTVSKSNTLQGGCPLDPNGSGQDRHRNPPFLILKTAYMIADVGKSTNIAATLVYSRNEKKGGEVILSSGIDPSLPAIIQAAALEAVHNPRFKIKAHTIVISHGDRDSKILTPEQEKKCLVAFLKELEAEGINLDAAPWLISRHGNTDNIHYHMTIMNTCYDGSRFPSEFLGAKATRAAARASLSIGLECPPKAAIRARKTKAPKEIMPKELLPKESKEKAKKYFNRRAAIEAAKKRKEYENEQFKTQKKQGESKKLPNRNQRDKGGEEKAGRTGWRR